MEDAECLVHPAERTVIPSNPKPSTLDLYVKVYLGQHFCQAKSLG